MDDNTRRGAKVALPVQIYQLADAIASAHHPGAKLESADELWQVK